MVGHCKLCLILLAGSILFEESLALNQAIGIMLTLGGIISYTHVKASLKEIYIKFSRKKKIVNKSLKKRLLKYYYCVY